MVLIGSTGNGKSTLGNYLLDPKADESNEVFTTAVDNRPQTKVCNCVTASVETEKHEPGDLDDMKADDTNVDDTDVDDTNVDDTNVDGVHSELEEEPIKMVSTILTVVDTPGLNESKESDLAHMINLINTLQRLKEIKGCILVVKFPCKLDQQFRDTVKYYSQLLPSLFEENTFIVMTGFGTDKYSEAVRKRQKITPDVMRVMTENVKKEIMEIAPLNCDPILFTIDSLPIDEKGARDSEVARAAILSYAMSRNEVNVQNLYVFKTKVLMDEDTYRIAERNGEIRGYNKKLQEANRKAEAALNGSEQFEKRITDFTSELEKLNRDLDEKDSKDLVTTNQWSVDNTSWLPWWRNEGFEIFSDYDIVDTTNWTNGRCVFSNVIQEGRRVRGKLKGKFGRRLYARFSVHTTKRLRYAEKITDMKKDIEIAQKDFRNAKEDARNHKAKQKEFDDEISDLEGFIATLREEITSLSNDRMSISEANKRLQELRSGTRV